jgi:CRP-like cAMP-binding protein
MEQVATLAHPDAGILRMPFIEKLDRFVDLSARERDYLARVQGDFTRIRTGADIITAGHTYRSIFVLSRGMAIRYKVLHDGRRQILSLMLPGDLIGFPGCLYNRSLYSVAAVDEAVVCPITFVEIFELFRRHPRIGIAIFWLAGQEATLFAEHLVGVGRQSAYERLARLLMELLVRLKMAGLAADQAYSLPLTQELMADTLGLSVPHLNRTLRKLREDGLIALDGNQLVCLDLPALARLAEVDFAQLWNQKIPGL